MLKLKTLDLSGFSAMKQAPEPNTELEKWTSKNGTCNIHCHLSIYTAFFIIGKQNRVQEIGQTNEQKYANKNRSINSSTAT